jgi:hypothetical protein
MLGKTHHLLSQLEKLSEVTHYITQPFILSLDIVIFYQQIKYRSSRRYGNNTLEV